jgi:hypothetical protein
MRPSRPQPVLDTILEAELASPCETQMSDVGSGAEKLIKDMIEGSRFDAISNGRWRGTGKSNGRSSVPASIACGLEIGFEDSSY